MSLENIEEYLKEVQAIKYYDTVKAENDELQKKNEEIEKAFQLKGNELVETNNTLLRERDSLYEEVVNLRTENDRIVKAIGGLTNELNKGSKEASNLNARIAELENLKVTTEGKSLKETEEAFVKVKNEEIQKVAEEHFNFMKAGWNNTRNQQKY